MEMTLEKSPSVAIILLNWNGLEHTKKCLDSLREITFANATVIVVDNGSQSEEVDALRSLGDIVLIENVKNLGFTGGNNVGINYAFEKGFDFIMLLNNDTVVEPNFIEPLILALQDPRVGAAQPKINTMSEKNVIWNAGGTFNKVLGRPITIGSGANDIGGYDDAKNIDWITGCCLIFPRHLVSDVGLLNDVFFILFEDVDWSLRARNAGYNLLYIPESKIYHFESATAKSIVKTKEGTRSPFRQYLNVRNHLFIVRRYVPFRFKGFAFFDQLFKISIYLGYYVLRGRWNKLRMTLRGLRDGLGEYRELS